MSGEKKQFRLGLVGYGEIGSTVGAACARPGSKRSPAMTSMPSTAPMPSSSRAARSEAGVTLVRSNQELADAARPDLQRNPRLGLARKRGRIRALPDRPAHLPRLRLGDPKDQDRRRRSARRDRRAAWATARSRARRSTAIPCACCRADPPASVSATSWCRGACRSSSRARSSGPPPGIKILRSVLIKGIEALTDEMLLAARQYGIDEIVLASAVEDAGAAMDGHGPQPDALRRHPRQAPGRGTRDVGRCGRRRRRRADHGPRRRGAAALEGEASASRITSRASSRPLQGGARGDRAEGRAPGRRRTPPDGRPRPCKRNSLSRRTDGHRLQNQRAQTQGGSRRPSRSSAPSRVANVSDSMIRMKHGGPRLRPLHAGGVLAGVALTVKQRPGDNLWSTRP